MHDPEAIYANLDSVGSQTNHYYCHELDCYISPQNEITGGCVANGIAFVVFLPLEMTDGKML